MGAINFEVNEGIAVIGLNRPDVINAINDEIRAGLPDALRRADSDSQVRVIILHGGEGRGFCAGADIKESRGDESPVQVKNRLAGHPWIESFDRIKKPVIAAVHGFCMGGGLEMALACDIRMASPDACFALPETALGLIPAAGGTQRLQRLVGLGNALDMILTGERMNAEQAYRLGIVSRLATSRDQLLHEALELAARIASRPPLATMYAKEAVRSGADMQLQAGLLHERSLFALLTSTKDKIEAAAAFKEKRSPKFVGD